MAPYLLLLACLFQNLKPSFEFLQTVESTFLEKNRLRKDLCPPKALDLSMQKLIHESQKVTIQRYTIQASFGQENVQRSVLAQSLIETGASCVEYLEEYPDQVWVSFAPEIDAGAAITLAFQLVGTAINSFSFQIAPSQADVLWSEAGSENFPRSQVCGKVQVLAVQDIIAPLEPGLIEVRLLPGQAWGHGDHPTTRLCLEFVSDHVTGGETFIDYGCGSAVLSIAAIKLGASKAIATDVCYDTLANAEQNLQMNGVADQIELMHPRTIVIGDLKADVVVANILPGVLIRLRHTLCLALKEGGLLCLSGMRPTEVQAVKEAFGNYIDWEEALTAHGSHSEWGFWTRLVGRPKKNLKLDHNALLADLSEAAVS